VPTTKNYFQKEDRGLRVEDFPFLSSTLRTQNRTPNAKR
jgi:hypothetical protein